MANDNFDLPRPTDAVPSATSAVINDDAKVLDYIVNGTGTVNTRTGKIMNTLKQLESNYIMSAVSDGTWQAGRIFTAFNQFMVYNGVSYKPKASASLPLTVLVAPDFTQVEPVGVNPVVVEVNSKSEEDAAFFAGALAVLRLDLIKPRSSLYMDFKNPSAFMDKSEFFHPMEKVLSPVIDDDSESPFGLGIADFSAGHITTADTLDLRFNSITGWCIECYLKIIPGGHNFIMSKGATGELNDAWYFALLTGGGGYNVTFTSRNNDSIISFAYPHALDTVNFHHISLNVDTTSARVYIDGVLAHTEPSFEFFNTAAELTVGAWNYTSAGVAGTYMDALNVSNAGAFRTADFNPPRG